jgi:hypothetical protein
MPYRTVSENQKKIHEYFILNPENPAYVYQIPHYTFYFFPKCCSVWLSGIVKFFPHSVTENEKRAAWVEVSDQS